MINETKAAPIGIFDSGYGGLTVFKEIAAKLPGYDYLYLGDNARSPYGTRSFETVYMYTLQAVNWFFKRNCPLIILACNTASAKALRSIQQHDLPRMYDPTNRILGVIRPTTELVGSLTTSNKVGILATNGTVSSNSYPIEIQKFWPEVEVFQQACPMWVPLVENNEYQNEGADYFIRKNVTTLMEQQPGIDTILLACTHYPLLKDRIERFVPKEVKVLSQGEIIAESLQSYLQRHPELEYRITKGGNTSFYTTDNTTSFDEKGSLFYGKEIASLHTKLPDDELLHNF
jgi:glutamate racemase